MKQILTGVALLVVATGFSQSAQKFTITGRLKNLANDVDKVYLRYMSAGERRTDSAVVVNGSYTISNTIVEPVRASLSVKYKPGKDGTPVKMFSGRDATSIFLSPGKIKVSSKDSLSNVEIKGSASQDAFATLEGMLKPLNAEMASLSTQWRDAKDEAAKKLLEPKFDEVDARMKEVYKAYVQANPKSPIAVYAVNQYAGYDIDAAKAQPVFDLLPASTKLLPSAVDLAGRLEIASRLAIGKPAMDFTQNDTLGKPVALSSLRGKVLLVDFWASWCGPCRRDNPNVVKVFNQYKDKGFHVLGVSLDQPDAHAKWIKAIHDDKLTWTHVSDLKFWDNEVAKMYGVRGIPFNLLLDKDGKIIGRNLHGEELEKKLASVMN